ncbi:MarR family protein [Micrococcales bacterium KH10]|nr:MarR family protein [Micrococcales bacterium KH10]
MCQRAPLTLPCYESNAMASRLIISDPAAVRAMTSPVRFLAVDELYATQRAMTATQLAEISGASPSAMSYHLRELERHGIVRRSSDAGDGRGRPWRACADDYVIKASDDADSQGHVSLIDSHMRPMQQRMIGVLNERAAQTPDHRQDDPYRVLVMESLTLTDQEIRDLGGELDSLLERYAQISRHRRNGGPAASRVEVLWSVVPKDPRTAFQQLTSTDK